MCCSIDRILVSTWQKNLGKSWLHCIPVINNISFFADGQPITNMCCARSSRPTARYLKPLLQTKLCMLLFLLHMISLWIVSVNSTLTPSKKELVTLWTCDYNSLLFVLCVFFWQEIDPSTNELHTAYLYIFYPYPVKK